jgi:hypothetical protein
VHCRRTPGVREVAIVSEEGTSGEKKVVAYVVAETGCRELFIQQNFPAEMPPADIVVVDAIPPMPTGEPNLNGSSMSNSRRT